MRRIAVAIVAALLALASTAGRATAQQPTIQSQIVGTWRTVSVTAEHGSHGKIDLFHGRVNGMTVFNADGHFITVITEHDTPKIATGNRQTLTPEEAVVIERQSYAMFGTYTVSEPGRAFTVHIIGSTFPNEVGADEIHRVSFAGEEMTYVNAKAATGGKDVLVTLRRVK